MWVKLNNALWFCQTDKEILFTHQVLGGSMYGIAGVVGFGGTRSQIVTELLMLGHNVALHSTTKRDRKEAEDKIYCDLIKKHVVRSHDKDSECMDDAAMVSSTSSISVMGLAIREGLNHPMRPFHPVDCIGLDLCYGILAQSHSSMGDAGLAPEKSLSKLILKGKHGKKTGAGFYECS